MLSTRSMKRNTKVQGETIYTVFNVCKSFINTYKHLYKIDINYNIDSDKKSSIKCFVNTDTPKSKMNLYLLSPEIKKKNLKYHNIQLFLNSELKI